MIFPLVIRYSLKDHKLLPDSSFLSSLHTVAVNNYIIYMSWSWIITADIKAKRLIFIWLGLFFTCTLHDCIWMEAEWKTYKNAAIRCARSTRRITWMIMNKKEPISPKAIATAREKQTKHDSDWRKLSFTTHFWRRQDFVHRGWRIMKQWRQWLQSTWSPTTYTKSLLKQWDTFCSCKWLTRSGCGIVKI